MEPRVEVDHLWEGYRPKRSWGWSKRGEVHWALRDVSLEVGPGETTGIIGGNGSGKTTLLKAIAGVFPPSRGRVVTRGRVASLVDLAAGVHRELTGHENLTIAGVLLGMSRAEVRARYEEIRDFAGLDAEEMSSPLLTYSAGMELRLGFSLVVHSRPAILIVDEVLAVGDEAFQGRCIQRIGELRDSGTSVILVSHELTMVRAHCDRVVVLEHGQVRFIGAPGPAIDRYHEIARRGLAPPQPATGPDGAAEPERDRMSPAAR
ncbi:MAG: ABC transporter ATP-binding protein [Candidatus Dormibacteria bacterium]